MTVRRILIPEPLPNGFALFYTTADFGGRTDDPELLAILRERFRIEAALATCTQVHGARVERAERAGTCDALWTAGRGVALGIKIADCLPISLCDSAHRVIANIHSGWRGAVQDITSATLDMLARESAFEPSEAYAYLGPSIRVCCFEVGEEVVDALRGACHPERSEGSVWPGGARDDPPGAVRPHRSLANARDDEWLERFIDRARGAKPHVDLVAMTAAVLRERGVRHVIDTGLCTRCGDQPLFHSYRRDKRSGRNLAIAAQ